jgi:hypothetical protein
MPGLRKTQLKYDGFKNLFQIRFKTQEILQLVCFVKKIAKNITILENFSKYILFSENGIL